MAVASAMRPDAHASSLDPSFAPFITGLPFGRRFPAGTPCARRCQRDEGSPKHLQKRSSQMACRARDRVGEYRERVTPSRIIRKKRASSPLYAFPPPYVPAPTKDNDAHPGVVFRFLDIPNALGSVRFRITRTRSVFPNGLHPRRRLRRPKHLESGARLRGIRLIGQDREGEEQVGKAQGALDQPRPRSSMRQPESLKLARVARGPFDAGRDGCVTFDLQWAPCDLQWAPRFLSR